MKRLLLLSVATLAFNTQSLAAPEVVVSIKPLHSIVSSVMDGVGEPKLIIEGSTSPHDFSLRPSQAKNIQDADLVVWIGKGLEIPLIKALETIPQDTKVIEVEELKGLKQYEFREDGHDHGSHDEHSGHGHDEHKHEEAEHKHDDHKHDNHAKAEHKHDDHAHDDQKKDSHAGHDHAEGGIDPHLWLDIDNMKVVTASIAETLKTMDPENAARYEANAKTLKESLGALEAEVAGIVKPAQSLEYVVFHDAYQYFEKQFGLKQPIAITLNPEVPPGAARIREIRKEVEENAISCLFSEPQFSPKVLEVVAENTQREIAVIDPLGSTIEPGKDHYSRTLLQMAKSFEGCAKK